MAQQEGWMPTLPNPRAADVSDTHVDAAAVSGPLGQPVEN
jgi:hypothetical protein